MATVEVDCTRANSGTINYDGSYHTYTNPAEIGWVSYPDDEYRAFFQFDTSDGNTGIPGTDVITKVEFYYNPVSPPISIPGHPDTWEWWFYYGDIIGATLDGNATEWTGGSLIYMHAFPSTPPSSPTWIWIPLLEDEINRSGNTDLKIIDTSSDDAPTGQDWYVSLKNGAPASLRTKIRLTYVTPYEGGYKLAPHAGI